MEQLLMPLRPLFADKLLRDDREPVTSFSLPFGYDGRFEVLAPGVALWVQLAMVVAVCSLIQCILASMLYYGIVKHRGTTAAYLLGWGFLIPFAITSTFWIIDGLALSNKVLKLGAGNAAMVIFFRSIEAMYGTSPPVTELNIMNYLVYNSTAAPYVWTEKSRKAPAGAEIRTLAKRCFLHFCALSLWLSMMMHFNYRPFHSNVTLNEYNFSWDLLAPGHLANAYLQTVMTYLTLYILFEINSLSENLKGGATEAIFINPLFGSRTPTEFWTVRWNRMVHKVLKTGIFLPAKKFLSPKISLLIAFIFSGLLHDYIWLGIFYHSEYLAEQEEKYSVYPMVPIVGQLTVFFMYTGVIMLLERPIGRIPFVQSISMRLPTIMISTLLVLIHLPFAHLYYGDWIIAGMFRDISHGLLLIRKVS